MICVTKTTVSTGASSGIVIRRKTCHSLAPSVRAASSVSRGIEARPAAVITIAKPALNQMNANMIAGVISLSPSQLTPPNGSAKVALATTMWYSPSSTSSKAKVPFVSVFVSFDLVARAVVELDGDAGQPQLPLLDLAGRAAAGLEVSPDDAGDPALQRLRLHGLDGVLGYLRHPDRRQAEQRDAARLDGPVEFEALLDRPGEVVRGRRGLRQHPLGAELAPGSPRCRR